MEIRIVGETPRSDSFVPQHIQDKLAESGWEKTFDEYMDREVTDLYPTGRTGSQTWEKVIDECRHYLYIMYKDDGKHTVNIYAGENERDVEVYKLRNIISVMKRRGYL